VFLLVPAEQTYRVHSSAQSGEQSSVQHDVTDPSESPADHCAV